MHGVCVRTIYAIHQWLATPIPTLHIPDPAACIPELIMMSSARCKSKKSTTAFRQPAASACSVKPASVAKALPEGAEKSNSKALTGRVSRACGVCDKCTADGSSDHLNMVWQQEVADTSGSCTTCILRHVRTGYTLTHTVGLCTVNLDCVRTNSAAVQTSQGHVAGQYLLVLLAAQQPGLSARCPWHTGMLALAQPARRAPAVWP